MTMLSVLTRAHDRLTRFGFHPGGAVLCGIVFSYWIEVVARYFFNAPTLWSTSVIAYCLCIAASLAMPELARRQGHIAITALHQFPVWSRGVSSLTTRLLDQGGTLNHPVSVGGVAIHPGDIVLADENGVIALSPAEVDDVVDHCLELQEQEQEILQRLAAGECLPDISGATALVEAGLVGADQH